MTVKTPRLQVRPATLADIPAIRALCEKVYGEGNTYGVEQLKGQIQHFPEGQLVATFDDTIIGYCATFRADESIVLQPHTWSEITGGGYHARHTADGDWLYGAEVFVDPDRRGSRIGQRLYTARKALCVRLGCKGVVFGGRLPSLHRRLKAFGTPEAFVNAVVQGQARDPVLSFQLRNGFEILGLLPNYLPSDKESLGYAAHLAWRNPRYVAATSPHGIYSSSLAKSHVRIAVVQYQQRKVASFEEFGTNVEYFVDVVADAKADFVLFPELFSLQLMSIENARLQALEAVRRLGDHTDALRSLLSQLAVDYNINIIGGTHPLIVDEVVRNVCFICLRDGSIHQQWSVHPTPSQRYWWNIQGGDRMETVATDCGPIGVLASYDAQFPELARHLADQGARIIFVPFCTEERQAYLRVRYSAQARAVENQLYVAMAGNVGNLPGVENMDVQYAQSCILTPCDFPFARDGIAADTTPNAEMVAIADVRLDDVELSRASGSVQNLRDRRFDLYRLQWQRPR